MINNIFTHLHRWCWRFRFFGISPRFVRLKGFYRQRVQDCLFV